MTAGFDDPSPRGDPPGGQGQGRGLPAARRRTAAQDWMLFQPRLALQGGRLRAVEAATRMPPSQAGRVAAGQAGLGHEAAPGGRAGRLAAWRLETAAGEIAGWRDTRARLCVAVPAELHPETLLSLLGDLGGQEGRGAQEGRGEAARWEHLELACPEAWLAALDEDGVMAMAAVCDLGVALAVEDFAESCASLSMLRRLPLGVVRLHASLVRDLERGEEDRAVLRAIVGAAHSVGLRVAATGVDTQRQGELLRGLGCDEGVGHALGVPMPSGQLARWIGGAGRDGAAARAPPGPERRGRQGARAVQDAERAEAAATG